MVVVLEVAGNEVSLDEYQGLGVLQEIGSDFKLGEFVVLAYDFVPCFLKIVMS